MVIWRASLRPVGRTLVFRKWAKRGCRRLRKWRLESIRKIVWLQNSSIFIWRAFLRPVGRTLVFKNLSRVHWVVVKLFQMTNVISINSYLIKPSLESIMGCSIATLVESERNKTWFVLKIRVLNALENYSKWLNHMIYINSCSKKLCLLKGELGNFENDVSWMHWVCIFFQSPTPPPQTYPPDFKHFPMYWFGFNLLDWFIFGWHLSFAFFSKLPLPLEFPSLSPGFERFPIVKFWWNLLYRFILGCHLWSFHFFLWII